MKALNDKFEIIMYEKISNMQMMETIKITGLFCPVTRFHPNSVLVVNKPVNNISV